jgi:ankyrin repeat protein
MLSTTQLIKIKVILAKQLIEHGANVNAVALRQGRTPLHFACCSGNVTNLDFIEYMQAEGADPSAQDHEGLTPLLLNTPNSPGAATFLLKWPTTNANTRIDLKPPS